MYFHLLYSEGPSIAHITISNTCRKMFFRYIKLAVHGMIITLTNKCTSKHWRAFSENTKQNQLGTAAATVAFYSWSSVKHATIWLIFCLPWFFIFNVSIFIYNINGYIYVQNHMHTAHHGIVSDCEVCARQMWKISFFEYLKFNDSTFLNSIRFKVETNFRPRWNWSVWHSGKIWLNNYTHGNWILEISVEILLDSKRSKRRKECCMRACVWRRDPGWWREPMGIWK